jgi:hypothetical protein
MLLHNEIKEIARHLARNPRSRCVFNRDGSINRDLLKFELRRLEALSGEVLSESHPIPHRDKGGGPKLRQPSPGKHSGHRDFPILAKRV